MPAIGFKYPDGEEVSFEDIFENKKLKLEKMGIVMPMLRELAKQRDPDRKPSVTECLIGTCEAYLKRTEDYYIDPQEHAFALAGTLHHSRLESNADDGTSEIAMEGMDITGIVDLYDEESKSLIDYKNVGSYKVGQALGLDFYLEDDPSGAVYLRKGKWGQKGEPKKVRRYWMNPEKADLGDWEWQINCYRYMLEKKGKEIKNMYVQVTVRDGGIQAARDRGIENKIYLIEVPYIHNDHIVDKFTEKRDSLVKSLKLKKLPEMCSEEETWGGKKCKSYCDARDVCPYNKEINFG
tara:strand:+ start:5423 stop:6304 length:882 start_codon:yes stop_codon:yes gene_type:complete